MIERSYRWLLWGLALVGTGLDQWSKYGVFNWLHPSDSQSYEGRHEVFAGTFELLAQFTGRTATGEMVPGVNQGALFGYRFGLTGEVANGFFAVVSVLAALAIIYWSVRRSTARDFSLCTALGLILAGTVGNLYDRLVFDGVRDFLHFYWYGDSFQFEWPVFNLADCCLVCGATLLLAQAFWSRPATAGEEVAQTALPRQVA